jgi:hypothetical protein
VLVRAWLVVFVCVCMCCVYEFVLGTDWDDREAGGYFPYPRAAASPEFSRLHHHLINHAPACLPVFP